MYNNLGRTDTYTDINKVAMSLYDITTTLLYICAARAQVNAGLCTIIYIHTMYIQYVQAVQE